MHIALSKTTTTWTLLILVLLTTLIACSFDEPTQESVTTIAEPNLAPKREAAIVEAVDIFQDDSFPVRVSVVARGHLPNECSSIDLVSQERSGGTFFITIDSVQYGGEACPANRVAYEESFDLDLERLPAGIYVVDVNGLQGSFKLQQDNVQDDGNAVVGGVVWHDQCELRYPVDGGDAEIAPDCASAGDGRFHGDGARAADESGIGGVVINLGTGNCPSSGLATTFTAADGTFLFSGLTAGVYCLTAIVDADRGGSLAVEGAWTYPDDSSGQQSVSIQPGDSKLDISFGWSPAQYPDETVTEPDFIATPRPDCTNKALFIADLSVPDRTPFSVGETFTKTWRLQNLGSCTWDIAYSLVPAAGDQMGAPDTVPLTITVPPGEFGELSLRLVAPETPGVYRSEWMLADPDGTPFGIGPGSDRAFWVEIVVSEVEAVG